MHIDGIVSSSKSTEMKNMLKKNENEIEIEIEMELHEYRYIHEKRKKNNKELKHEREHNVNWCEFPIWHVHVIVIRRRDRVVGQFKIYTMYAIHVYRHTCDYHG